MQIPTCILFKIRINIAVTIRYVGDSVEFVNCTEFCTPAREEVISKTAFWGIKTEKHKVVAVLATTAFNPP